MRQIKNLRWWIAGLLAAATALNYLDRQSLPVVVGEIQKERAADAATRLTNPCSHSKLEGV